MELNAEVIRAGKSVDCLFDVFFSFRNLLLKIFRRISVSVGDAGSTVITSGVIPVAVRMALNTGVSVSGACDDVKSVVVGWLYSCEMRIDSLAQAGCRQDLSLLWRSGGGWSWFGYSVLGLFKCLLLVLYRLYTITLFRKCKFCVTYDHFTYIKIK